MSEDITFIHRYEWFWTDKAFASDCAVIYCDYHPIFWHTSDREIAQEVERYLKESGKTKVVFINRGDGFTTTIMDKVNSIVRHLLENKILTEKQMLWFCSSQPCQRNVDLYLKQCQKYNWIPIELGLDNNWETSGGEVIRGNDRAIYDSIDLTPRIKPKNILCFNRRGHSARWALLAEFIDNNLLDKAYYSFYRTREEFLFDSVRLPNLYHKVISIIDAHKEILPLQLNIQEPLCQQWFDPSQTDLPYFQSSYLSLCTETVFFEDIDSNYGEIDNLFFSEKTYKPIQMKHPFILAARPRALEQLRQDGYQTFGPVIDESYDEIENDEHRLLAIIKEVKRLYEFTDNDWIKFQEFTRPIVEHNWNVLSERTHRAYFTDESFRGTIT